MKMEYEYEKYSKEFRNYYINKYNDIYWNIIYMRF